MYRCFEKEIRECDAGLSIEKRTTRWPRLMNDSEQDELHYVHVRTTANLGKPLVPFQYCT